MEHVVDLPFRGDGEAISDRGEDFGNQEGSFSFGCELAVFIEAFQIACLEPHLISFQEGRELCH